MKDIYILDDSEEVMNLVECYLKKISCEVVKFKTAQDLIAGVKRKAPDLCMIDIDLGNERKDEGLLLAMSLKKYFKNKTKVAMMSSLKDPCIIKKSYEHYIDEYFTKPFDEVLLLEKISLLLGTQLLNNTLPIRSVEKGIVVGFTGDFEVVAIDEEYLEFYFKYYIKPDSFLKLEIPWLLNMQKQYNLNFRVMESNPTDSEQFKYQVRTRIIVHEDSQKEFQLVFRKFLSNLKRDLTTFF